MSERLWQEANRAQTLKEVHDLVNQLRPRSDAPQEEWLSFFRRSSAVYERVAGTDRYHHHEALHWARWERKKADEIAESSSTESTKGKTEKS